MISKFYELLIAFGIGLIPLTIQLYFNFRRYRRSQKDKYGSFLYEKQYDVYCQLYSKFEQLNDKTQEIFINQKNPGIAEVKKEKGLNTDTDYLKILDEVRDLVKKNTLILPNKLIKDIYTFNQLNNVVRNTILRRITQIENTKLKIIDEVGGLKAFSLIYNEAFMQMLKIIKDLIGTEFLSEDLSKYVKKKKKAYTEFTYYSDRQAKIE